MRKFLSIVALVCAVGILATACGGGKESGDDTAANDGSVEVVDAETTENNAGSEVADSDVGDQDGTTLSADADAASPDGSQPIRIGAMFAPTDTLDPTDVTTPGGMMLLYNLYDSLALVTDSGLEMSLAESITPNDTVDEWTVKLRPNVTFSDGTPITGDDVLASIAYCASSPNYQSILGVIDLENSFVEGDEILLKLHSPTSDFVVSSIGYFSPIAPQGKFTGIGAGPYTLVGGSPSTGYSLKANPNYWKGEPNIPEINIIQIPDSASQAKALLANEIDYAWGLDPVTAQQLKGSEEIVMPEPTLDSAIAKDLILNTRVAPFNDPEVRQAAKLTIDREKMVQVLLGEAGEVGNDVLGKGYQDYPEDLPQIQASKDEASRIFAEKGVTEFTIVASDTVPGMIAAAEFLVQEFEEVGVTVTIEQLEPMTFFSNMEELYQSQAFTFYWINRSPLVDFRSQAVKDSPYNASGYSSDNIMEQMAIATATPDESTRQEAIKEICIELNEQGGDLIWGYQKQLSAHRAGLEHINSFQSIPWLVNATFNP
ncbi:MAG: ABC transporter substrate-binding protein [Fastidiosipilaceae bacterium]|jgi:peptide/nickel transport system substrate-binding protein|nr:ABC transporter substrate-binding protein [Clostridiaceae bacterium]